MSTQHTNPITAQQIPAVNTSYFALWDGEQQATVHQSVGAHGFCSAVVVVEHIDGPMKVHTYTGYDGSIPRAERIPRMAEWVAATLNTLTTGTQYAVGTYGTIEQVEGFEGGDLFTP